MKSRVIIASVFLAVFALAGCGGEPELVLSPAGQEGRKIANASGCASCHGKNGQGITAPSWQGIYLEPVPLEPVGSVIADDEYLYRSITDPQADLVRGWTIKMPENDLDDAQVAAIIDYIKELD